MFDHPLPPATPASDTLRTALANLSSRDHDEIVFDPATGQILVAPRGKAPINDAVPATIIARSGFFSGGQSV